MERGERLAATASLVCAAWNACVFLLGFFFFQGLSSCVLGRPGDGVSAPSVGSPCRMAARADGFSTRVEAIDPATRQPQHKTAPL